MTMNDDRRRVLSMLAEGKINADEAERLLTAVERDPLPAVGGAAAVHRSNGAPSLPTSITCEM